jgi:prepilin-type N-terminal cleavage/methylation domain-containing protein
MKIKGFTLLEVLVVALIVGIYITSSSDLVCEHTAATILQSIIVFITDRDPNLDVLTPGIKRDIDELNSLLGSFKVKLPEEYTIEVLIIDKDNITVFVQDDEYMGSASVGT